MSDLKECRHNKNHKVKAGRLFIHETNCPDKMKSGLVRCSYDINHLVKKENLENHLRNCDKRPNIDPKVHQEMLEYVLKNGTKNKSTKASSNTKSNTNLSNNNQSGINNQPKKFIAGLGPIEDKKANKRQQSEFRQLVNNSNLYPLSEIAVEDQFDLIDFEEEYSQELNDSLFTNNKNLNNRRDENSVIISNKEDDSGFGFPDKENLNVDENRKNKLLFHSSNLENDEYDPNSSDIFIDRRNKNNINESGFVYYK